MKFLSNLVPELQLKFDQTNVALIFGCDPGREEFRVMLKKALDLKKFKREYVRPEGDEAKKKDEKKEGSGKDEKEKGEEGGDASSK